MENKQLLLDFTTVSPLSTNLINNAWKQSGYAAHKAETSKHQSCANADDVFTNDFLPRVLQLGGCPGIKDLQSSSQILGKMLDNTKL